MTEAVERVSMTDQEYFATPGLSFSGMKDLAVSPLRYWYLHVNPNRPIVEPSAEMQLGTALHCAILEPSKFDARFCPAFDADSVDGALTTIDDIKQWLADRGCTLKGKCKDEWIDIALGIDPQAPIVAVLKAAHDDRNSSKTQFKNEAWVRIAGMAEALRNEPHVNRILSEGSPEVTQFAKDKRTGIVLKCKIDWMAPWCNFDLKTFSTKQRKSIDKTVNDSIFWDWYYAQSYFYDKLRRMDSQQAAREMFDSLIGFVESDPPHETRLRLLAPKIGGEVNMYWERSRHEVTALIDLYADCVSRFGVGEKPWRDAQEIAPLIDHDLPMALNY